MAELVRTSHDDGVTTVHLCDEAGRNALDEAFAEALMGALAGVGPETRVVLLQGLPEVFCSGASLDMLHRLATGAFSPTELLLSRALLALPVPCVAAMEGHAVGGGLALGLCADLVFIARESRYGCPFMDLGFTPGMGTTRLLELVLSAPVAHELLYTGELRRGADLVGTGFNGVLPRAELLPHARLVARRMAEKPRGTLLLLKRQLSLPRRMAFEAAHVAEVMMHSLCFDGSEDLRARLDRTYVQPARSAP